MPFCINCGQETSGANYCPNCGFPQGENSSDQAQATDQAYREASMDGFTTQAETFTYDQSYASQQTYGQAAPGPQGPSDGPAGYEGGAASDTMFDDSVTYDPRYVYEQQQAAAAAAAADQGSFGWAVLGFFIPLVGLILFLVWRETKPVSSKQAGMGALVSVIVSLVLTVVTTCAGIALVAVSGS